MKKHHKRHADHQPVSRADELRFRGDIGTIFYNLAAVITYAVFLKFALDNTLAMMVFGVLAGLQLIVCAAIGINYNSKMWLISALLIFLMGCLAVVYVSLT